MTRRSPTAANSLLALLAILALLAPLPAAAQPSCLPAAELAERILAGRSGWGDLELASHYSLDQELLDDQGRLVAAVVTELGPKALGALRGLGSAELCVALVLDVDGELMVRQERKLDTGDLRGAEAWRYGLRTELADGTGEILIVVQEPASGLWGAAVVDDAGEALPAPGPAAVRIAGGEAWTEAIRPVAAAALATAPTVVRLVPPRQATVAGGTRFDALVSTDAVDRVVFRLDGREVADKMRRPFAARIPLDDPPRMQTLEAVAFDQAGREMGRDVLEVNRVDVPFRVRITELTTDPATGGVNIAAEVTVPAGSALDRLELYRNQELVARFDGSFRHRLPAATAGPEDYLRVAAFLTDGSSIDDVALLAIPGGIERVEVNLVELQVVATDREGKPVADLRPQDFTIVYRGNHQPPQSFAYADDVPLLLGVVIDTSGSMQLVMHDTRKAAAKFLGTTVLPQDRAFLVDFDKQPRLLHPTTDDLPALLLDLAKLQAEGSTALYDAIVFSMLQFERVRGRKALVILTDGDDYESRFGPSYCAELGQRAGVPIYIIGLGQLDILRRTYSKSDLRKVTSETGGRFYLVNSLEELGAAYAQINAELRSQYSLSFYTDRDLDAKERGAVAVEIGRPGLEARAVVGAQRSAE